MTYQLATLRAEVVSSMYAAEHKDDARNMLHALDAIIALQSHPEATSEDLWRSSELYAFLVNDGRNIYSEIGSWPDALSYAEGLLDTAAVDTGL